MSNKAAFMTLSNILPDHINFFYRCLTGFQIRLMREYAALVELETVLLIAEMHSFENF